MELNDNLERVSKILMTRNEYVSEDGKLLKAKVYADCMTMKPELLSLLLSDAAIKALFFTKVENVEVFDKQKFGWFIEAKEFLPDSFTRYSNKIGLAVDGKFISKSNDVVLDFPYKDCVLEGGQDKEDQKRDEVFYHETIASDEISRMLAAKVFSNAKRYTKDGVEENIEFDENDNLIIKGNNLIAISSLLERYEGKVKSVVIDPPYFFNVQKPTDTFSYNSNFKLSSWLVFMKNRLEISRNLLIGTGIVFVAISDEGAHYLKVLLDSVFEPENFIADVTWESRNSISSDGLFSMNSNHILVYAKDKNMVSKNDFRLALDLETFKYDDNDGMGKYRLEPFDAPKVRKNLEYPIKNPNTGETYYPPQGRHWRTTKENYLKLLNENKIRFGVAGTARPQYKAYYSEVSEAGKGKTSSSIWSIDTNAVLWRETNTNTSATKHQQEMFGEEVFTNPKPEELIKQAIELSSSEGDIILDFFAGSGTTAAVAHKMGRRYIGVEQMDYINTITVPRLQKVIDGEQGGISKSVDWQGGGSFVYCELKENSQELIDLIAQSTSDNIKEIKNRIYTDERIVSYITKEELHKADELFEDLTLQDKKKALIALVDKNKLYVNYSDIEDEDYNVSEADKKFTKSFYKGASA